MTELFRNCVNYDGFTRISFGMIFAAVFLILFFILLYKLCYLYFEVIDVRIVSNRLAGLAFVICLLLSMSALYAYTHYYWYFVHLLYRV